MRGAQKLRAIKLLEFEHKVNFKTRKHHEKKGHFHNDKKANSLGENKIVINVYTPNNEALKYEAILQNLKEK